LTSTDTVMAGCAADIATPEGTDMYAPAVVVRSERGAVFV
jgi:hypothetical protein